VRSCSAKSATPTKEIDNVDYDLYGLSEEEEGKMVEEG